MVIYIKTIKDELSFILNKFMLLLMEFLLVKLMFHVLLFITEMIILNL